MNHKKCSKEPTSIVWRKSSASSGNGGQCVEVEAYPDDAVAIRDSKHHGAGMIVASRPDWSSLLSLVSNDDGRFQGLVQGGHA